MSKSDPHSPLTGSLLLASPSLRDPNFNRSVIYLAAHSEEDGSFGYVLNRPLEQKVAELLPDQELGALGRVQVFIGGPVSTNKLAFASLHWSRSSGTLHCKTHLSVHDAMHELSMGHDVRGFVGYSGWSKGQVEREIQHRSWIVTTPVRQVLTLKPEAGLWNSLLEGMGPVYQLISRTPEKVELN